MVWSELSVGEICVSVSYAIRGGGLPGALRETNEATEELAVPFDGIDGARSGGRDAREKRRATSRRNLRALSRDVRRLVLAQQFQKLELTRDERVS